MFYKMIVLLEYINQHSDLTGKVSQPFCNSMLALCLIFADTYYAKNMPAYYWPGPSRD